MKKPLFVVLTFLLGCNLMLEAQSAAPTLRKQGTATQLIVEGKPFLMLAGELHNSSTSSIEYMEPIWPQMAAKNLNTVLAVVAWEQLEPVEGRFDFTLVDAMIRGAEKSNLKLVLLWFGSWKNGGSIYMPSWVKKDYKRFPRAQNEKGESIEILSTLSENSMKADAKAFAALMKHLKEFDKNYTVLMVQVENEMGILNTVRDFSPAANAAFNGEIPADLSAFLSKNKNNLGAELSKVWKANGSKTKGTWEEVFGRSTVNHSDWRAMSFYTEELFMAYHYAKYVGYIAAEGKKEYDIPLYVNAWLKGPDYPWTGRFPGGGPLPQVMDMWHCGAPAIDFLSPDIYLPIFTEVVANYDRLGNAIFVPETRGGAIGASRLLWALGEHNLIGFSPFGIDGRRGAPAPTPVPTGAPVTGTNAPRPVQTVAGDPLADTYALLEGMTPMITAHQGKGTIRGMFIDQDNPTQSFELGDYIVTADASSPRTIEANPAGGLIINLGKDEYIVIARGLNVRFAPKVPGNEPLIGIDKVYEGVFDNAGNWKPGRLLNGDETHCSTFSGTGLKMPGLSIQRITLYRYK
ncbi:MAG: DUF5597 domain-containing protein [Prevotellaceae bacterium]|jgi:hypothetical protein|nr:DUF5597 domain-containing protein [Prevotellaceae bacterium]